MTYKPSGPNDSTTGHDGGEGGRERVAEKEKMGDEVVEGGGLLR